MSRRGRPPYPDILTPREQEVLALVRDGLKNEQIAQRLGISIDGAKYHVSEMLSKLYLENRADLALWRPEAPTPRWVAAFAPLLFWRHVRLDWLSPVVAGALVLGVAAGIGVLVWALIVTNGDGDGAGAALALPAGDRLAYVGVDGNLWLLEGDGPAQRLTDLGAVSRLRWSPDGRYVLFLNDDAKPADPPAVGWEPEYSLWLHDVASGEQTLVAEGVVSAEWSPRSDRIAYWTAGTIRLPDGTEGSTAYGRWWLYEVDSGKRTAPLPDDFEVVDLAWSPDGQTLALARYVEPVFQGPDENPVARLSPDSTIWLLDVSSTGRQPERIIAREELALAFPEEWQTDVNLGPTGVANVSWSPDGGSIVFHATSLSASLAADGLPLMSVRRDGSQLAYHGFMLRSEALLDWFPGGHRFAFTSGGGREVYYAVKRVALAEAGVEGATEIASAPPLEPQPTWLPTDEPPWPARTDAWPAVSPDGAKIAFQTSEASWNVAVRLDVGKFEGPKEGIWVANADGSDPRQLTSDPNALDFLPRWSADGEFILFVRTDGKPFAGDFGGEGSKSADLWMIRADGSDARLLVRNLLRTGSYYGLFNWEEYVAWYRAGG